MEIPMFFKYDSVIDLVRVGLVSPGLKFFHSLIFSDSKSTMWLLLLHHIYPAHQHYHFKFMIIYGWVHELCGKTPCKL